MPLSTDERELLIACRLGKTETVRSLLAKGVSPNLCDAAERSAVEKAATNDHFAILQLLADAGAVLGEHARLLTADDGTIREAIRAYDEAVRIALFEAATAALEEFGSDIYGFALLCSGEMFLGSDCVFTEEKLREWRLKNTEVWSGCEGGMRWWPGEAAHCEYRYEIFAKAIDREAQVWRELSTADMREAVLAGRPYDDSRTIHSSVRISEVVFLRALAALSDADLLERKVVLTLQTGDQSNESILAYAELLNPPETIQRLRPDLRIDESKLAAERLRIPAFRHDDVLECWDGILAE